MFHRHYSGVESGVAVVSYLVEHPVDVVVVDFLVWPVVDVVGGSTIVVVASVETGSVVAGLMLGKRLIFVESIGVMYYHVKNQTMVTVGKE